MFFAKKHMKYLWDLGPVGYLSFKIEPFLQRKTVNGDMPGDVIENATVLGSGKDGIVYLSRVNGKPPALIKRNNAYGQSLQFRAEQALSVLSSPVDAFYQVSFDERGYTYTYQELADISTKPEDFLLIIKQLIELTGQLLEEGFYYWDFGSSDFNYRLNPEKKTIKIIDYGGNSFVQVDHSKGHFLRRFIHQPDGRFLKAQLLYHIAVLGLGCSEVKYWQSMSQFSQRAIGRGLKYAAARLEGTVYHGVALRLLDEDFDGLDASAWRDFSESLSTDHSGTQESADISKLEFEEDSVVVRGYQDFVVSRESVVPIASGKIWDTQIKSRLVKQSLEKITEQWGNSDLSVLDIGCNLGVYVFTAVIEHGFSLAVGVDYNEEYIRRGREISSHLGLDKCVFRTEKFSEIDEKYDVVMALGIIHHLFQRTESYGEIESLLKKMWEISTLAIIVEFPSENDPKAKKWTKIPGRQATGAYSLQHFLDSSNEIFSSVELIGKSAADRYIYLLVH